jgi:hypothetical protein
LYKVAIYVNISGAIGFAAVAPLDGVRGHDPGGGASWIRKVIAKMVSIDA